MVLLQYETIISTKRHNVIKPWGCKYSGIEVTDRDVGIEGTTIPRSALPLYTTVIIATISNSGCLVISGMWKSVEESVTFLIFNP